MNGSEKFRSFYDEMILLMERLSPTANQEERIVTLITIEMEMEELAEWQNSTDITPKQRKLGSALMCQLVDKLNVLLGDSQNLDEDLHRAKHILMKTSNALRKWEPQQMGTKKESALFSRTMETVNSEYGANIQKRYFKPARYKIPEKKISENRRGRSLSLEKKKKVQRRVSIELNLNQKQENLGELTKEIKNVIQREKEEIARLQGSNNRKRSSIEVDNEEMSRLREEVQSLNMKLSREQSELQDIKERPPDEWDASKNDVVDQEPEFVAANVMINEIQETSDSTEIQGMHRYLTAMREDVAKLVTSLRGDVDRILAAFGEDTPFARDELTWTERVELKRRDWVHPEATDRFHALAHVLETEDDHHSKKALQMKWIINDLFTAQKEIIALLDAKEDYKAIAIGHEKEVWRMQELLEKHKVAESDEVVMAKELQNKDKEIERLKSAVLEKSNRAANVLGDDQQRRKDQIMVEEIHFRDGEIKKGCTNSGVQLVIHPNTSKLEVNAISSKKSVSPDLDYDRYLNREDQQSKTEEMILRHSIKYGKFDWDKQTKELTIKNEKLRKAVDKKNKQIADLERELQKTKNRTEVSIDAEGERTMLEQMMVEEILDKDLVILDRGKEIENLKKTRSTASKLSIKCVLGYLMLAIFVTAGFAAVWTMDTEYMREKMSSLSDIALRAVDQYIVDCNGTPQYLALKEQVAEQDDELVEQMILQELSREHLQRITQRMEHEMISRDLLIGALKSELQRMQSQDVERETQLEEKLMAPQASTDDATIADVIWNNQVANLCIGSVCAVATFGALHCILEKRTMEHQYAN